ncbi:MAG: AAA family ATPase [Blastocatellia bacterium]|nr:AAA family ATPase [Blastocatellia bacterium]
MLVPMSVIVIGKDAQLRTETRAHLAATGRVHVIAESADYQRATELIGQLRPQGAIILVNGGETAALDLVRQTSRTYPYTAIICTGKYCTSEIVVRAYRAGAHEFLMQPPDPQELREVLERLEALLGEEQVSRTGRVIAVYSSRGGSGTTTIAVNVATALARRARQETVLVDLNLQYGCLPVFFGVEPTYSLTDVAHNESRLDIQLLRSFLTKVSDGIYYLAAPIKPEEADDIFPAHLETVLGLLRTQFAHVVLDTSHVLDPITIAALDHADLILLVTLGDLASLYTTKRVLETFRRMGYETEKVRLVLNRYRNKEVPLGKIEEVLGQKVAFTLAEDARAALEAINVGRPVVLSESKSPLVRQFVELMKLVAPVETASASRGKSGRRFFSALLGGGER